MRLGLNSWVYQALAILKSELHHSQKNATSVAKEDNQFHIK